MRFEACLTAALLLAALVTPAGAHPTYQRGFQDLYAKGAGVDKDFRKLVRKAKCNVCHQGKKDRKNYNGYGTALLDHLSEGDEKDKEKLAAALEAVANLPSEGAGSATYAELIASGSLPGGPLDESEAEPPTPAE